MPRDHTVPDGGYAWVVLLAGFLLQILYATCSACLAVLKVQMSLSFETSMSTVGWMGSVLYGTRLTGVFFGGLVSTYGPRVTCMVCSALAAAGFIVTSFAPTFTVVLIGFGLVAGLGTTGLMLGSTVVLQYYFEKKRALATGIALLGGSVSALCTAPFYGFMLATIGWRGTLRVHAAILLQGVVLGSLLRPIEVYRKRPPRKIEAVTKEETIIEATTMAQHPLKTQLKKCQGIFNISLFKSFAFTLFTVGNVFVAYGLEIVYHESASRAVSKGVTLFRASLLNTAIGTGSFCGRVSATILGSSSCTNRTLLFTVCTLIGGALVILIAATANYKLSLVMAGLYGLMAGCVLTLLPTVTVDLVGVDMVAQGQGWLLTTTALAQLTVLPMSGAIYDATKSYDLPFYFGGTAQLIGGFLVLLILVHKQFCARNETHTCDVTEVQLHETLTSA